jgi:hypothetical protein
MHANPSAGLPADLMGKPMGMMGNRSTKRQPRAR